MSVNPNAKVAHIPVQKVQDKSAPWRPRHEFDLSLSRRGMDPGPLGVPSVSGIRALAVDPLSPAGCEVGPPWIRLVSLVWLYWDSGNLDAKCTHKGSSHVPPAVFLSWQRAETLTACALPSARWGLLDPRQLCYSRFCVSKWHPKQFSLPPGTNLLGKWRLTSNMSFWQPGTICICFHASILD